MNDTTMIFGKFWFAILLIAVQLMEYTASLKVAIVGGGIGAASSVFHLRKHLGEDVSISLYDGGPIGGRIQEFDVNGALFEGGASIIHKRNLYMREFTRLLNLSECEVDGKNVLSVFNGVKPAFVGSTWSWVNTIKLMWRYGPDLLRIQWLVTEMLDKFDQIYQIQNDGKAFADLETMLNAWHTEFPAYLNLSLADYLLSKGSSERFVDELANAGTRCNYNQRAKNVHAFVGMVSMAGALPGLFSVCGGNAQVARGLVKSSNADVHEANVISIEETSGTVKSPSYALHLSTGDVHRGFDYVILAAPRYSKSSTAWPKFVNIEPDLPPIDKIQYQPVTATFVIGDLNTKHFRLPDSQLPYAIFMSGKARTDPVNSVELHSSVHEEGKGSSVKAWKIFSAGINPLPSKTIDKMFSKHSIVKAKTWHGAYPKYSVPTTTSGLRFMIAPQLITLYPIEQLASAMEMSAIAGANAALLVKNENTFKGQQIHGVSGSGRLYESSIPAHDEM